MYDSIGNVTSVKKYDYTTEEALTGTYTEQTFTYGDSSNPDKLTAFDGKAITYDNFGRPVTYGDWTFVWTNGRLTRMCDDIDDTSWSSSEDIRFNYNGYGQRISKSYSYDSGDDSSGDYITGTSNAYDYDSLGRLIHERFTTYHNESATVHRDLVYLYDESGIIGVLYTLGGTTTGYYYRRNLQGDVVGIYDKSGTRMAEYAYDAFGNCSLIYQSSGTDIGDVNPIRYRGYYYDHETGMYYLGSRYYNPQWRRFISPSTSAINPSVVNGLNGYLYCKNDSTDNESNVLISGKIPNMITHNSALRAGTSNINVNKGIINGFSLPKANSIVMIHQTNSLIENDLAASIIGNISYTRTKQIGDCKTFYSYVNTGNGGTSYGVGINANEWYGISAYITSDFGIGISKQITPWITYGVEISAKGGLSVSGGIISGDTTHEISFSIGWGPILVLALVSTGYLSLPAIFEILYKQPVQI